MGNRFVWALAFLTGCGSSAGNPSSTVEPGAAGNGGASGVGGGFNPIASSSGSGGRAGSANASSAGSAGSSTAGGPTLPSNATVLGPYGFNGSYGSSAMQWDYALSLPGDGFAFFMAEGSMQLNQPATVTTGLLRAPSGSAVGTDWVCPGPAATWVPTKSDDTPDCSSFAARCSYDLIMPAPSQLSCAAASTGGSLAFSPAASDGTSLSTATSSLATLSGKMFYLGAATLLTLDPAPMNAVSPTGVSFSENGAGSALQALDMLFKATPVTPNAGAPVTQWTLSDISVIYHPMGSNGPTDLLCATGGTYQISSTMPIQHSVTLTGVSDPLACPGKATATPLVLEIGN